MDYHLVSQGQLVGIFPLSELERRRQAGTLTGSEFVWAPGMTNWQTLDTVLGPAALRRTAPMSRWVAFGVALAVIVSLAGGFFFFNEISKIVPRMNTRGAGILGSQLAGGGEENPGASQPIATNANTTTEWDAKKLKEQFCQREYAEAYQQHGDHNQPWDKDARRFISGWIDYNFGRQPTNSREEVNALADKLVADKTCNDPIVMLLAGVDSPELFEASERLNRASASFGDSTYDAYPQFYNLVLIQTDARREVAHGVSTDPLAMAKFIECLSDGSLQRKDQPIVADIFIEGWGQTFYQRNEGRIVNALRAAGTNFEWLTLTMQGQHEINQAWAARGSGMANTVTSAGWEGFSQHLAAARTALTRAWTLHPEWPQAPAMMISVAMGESDVPGLRQWFDRATTAQIDYGPAWRNLRWALRPRWFGSLPDLLALGKEAVATGRFDTDVPRKYFDCVYDIEQEEQTPAGSHIYGEKTIWPTFKKMYEGYIAYAGPSFAAGWRQSYAVVSYFAGNYDVAAEQLSKLDWQLSYQSRNGWLADLDLMPLEVAARTGSRGAMVKVAEEAWQAGSVNRALSLYQELAAKQCDERTARFIQGRLNGLNFEKQLQSGQWVDFAPQDKRDPDWSGHLGEWSVLPEGGVEVRSGHEGFLLLSHAPVGGNFEVRGEFEVVHSTSSDFQAGLVMGLPQYNHWEWYGFRMKRNRHEHDVVSFSEGWSSVGTTKPFPLQSTDNTFDFKFDHGVASATVNGEEALSGVPRPVNLQVPENRYLLGLGAFNDMNDTIIRYHHIQVRRLGRNLD